MVKGKELVKKQEQASWTQKGKRRVKESYLVFLARVSTHVMPGERHEGTARVPASRASSAFLLWGAPGGSPAGLSWAALVLGS